MTPQPAPSAGRPPPPSPGRRFPIRRRWAERSSLLPCRRPSPGCWPSPPRPESRSGSLRSGSPRSRRQRSTPTRSIVAGWGVRNARDRTQNDASGAVFALDQRTGRERWRFLTPARFGPVSVGQDAVYVPSDRGLFAIDRATGRKRWQARFSPGAGDTATVAGETDRLRRLRDHLRAIRGIRARCRQRRLALARRFAASAGSPGGKRRRQWPRLRFLVGRASKKTPEAARLHCAPTTLPMVTSAGCSARMAPRMHEQVVGAGSMTSPVVVGDTVLFGVAVRAPAPGSGGNADGLYAVDTATGEVRWQPLPPRRSVPRRPFSMGRSTRWAGCAREEARQEVISSHSAPGRQRCRSTSSAAQQG